MTLASLMRNGSRRWAIFGLAAVLVTAASARAQPIAPARAQSTPPAAVAPFVATPSPLVDDILALANVGPADFVVDLGSGDGRLVIAAVAKYKARGGFGVDIDPALVKLANENAAKAGVADRVQFFERDLFATDVGQASVVTVYLLPDIMARVEAKLAAELKPGARVVVHDYPFPTWRPVRVLERESPEKVPISGTPLTRLMLYVK